MALIELEACRIKKAEREKKTRVRSFEVQIVIDTSEIYEFRLMGKTPNSDE